MNLLTPTNEVFSLLIQQEGQQLIPIEENLITHTSKTYMHACNLEINPRNYSTNTREGIKTRTCCNKPGHTIKVSFKKHKHPPYLKKLNIAHFSIEDTS